MPQLSPDLIMEASNRMALDLFRAAEFRTVGLTASTDHWAERQPRELTRLGIDPSDIAQVILNAHAIFNEAQTDLSDEGIRNFIGDGK